MIKVKKINRSCVILEFGGVAKPVFHIVSTRYPMKEYVILNRKRVTDNDIQVFGESKVSRLEMDIKPEELFDTMIYIFKDDDVVLPFFLVTMKL